MTPRHEPRRLSVLIVIAAAIAWTAAPSARQSGQARTGRGAEAAAQGPAATAAAHVISVGVRFADTVMATWPDPATIDPAKNGWEYNTGIVLFGMSKVYEATHDPPLPRLHPALGRRLRERAGRARLGPVAGRTTSTTSSPACSSCSSTSRPGLPKYKAAAETVREAFDKIPKNADGGFWHKGIHPNEMWIDGIYMGEPFLVRYGQLFGDAAFGNDMAVVPGDAGRRALPRSEDRPAVPRLGPGPERGVGRSEDGPLAVIWGRGMGWYVMAMVDILERLPAAHPGYPRLLDLLKKNVAGLASVQDPKTGLWFQVLDQPSLTGNWLEHSSSGMFIYAIRKAVRLKLVDPKYGAVADRAWKGLQATFEKDAAGRPVFTEAVQGMGVQKDAAGYLAIPRLKNSTHGLMAVQIAASEMERRARRRTCFTRLARRVAAGRGRAGASPRTSSRARSSGRRRSSSTPRCARGTGR